MPTGGDLVRENFDTLPLGGVGGLLASGISVTFSGGASAVQGASSSRYAAPFLSGRNGLGFGSPDQANGVDRTTYLQAGSLSLDAAARIVMSFSGLQAYLGLLWGSVDSFNVITFFAGEAQVGSISGTDVVSAANGNQAAGGTRYVNITATAESLFDRVVLTSALPTFELDNVAISRTVPTAVPEPASLALFGAALLGLGLAWRRAPQSASAAKRREG